MMNDHEVFWRLEALSDRQLLEQMSSVLGSSRRLMAELIAHLGEVEERRLHLASACSSLFAYCLKLGMTEDEAYRRIEVARLARRYPAVFPLLANGQLSISVVALLKHYLSDENHVELLAAVTGKSVTQTRDLIAARFPRPDVASSVRKLPERRTIVQPSLAVLPLTEVCATVANARATESREPDPCRTESPGALRCGADPCGTDPCGTDPCGTDPCGTESPGAVPCETDSRAGRARPPHPVRASPPRSSRIEPLSAHRYKIQLTASAELARKLQLATDLMRHAHPSGELGLIVERAVDLLIESLMQRRFGKSRKASTKRTTQPAGRTPPEQRDPAIRDRATIHGGGEGRTTKHDTLPADAAAPAPGGAEPDATNVHNHLPGELTGASTSSYIPRSTRRTVLERDGLGCSWVDEHGVRCGSRAWLEYDHRHPRAKGGGSEPENLRIVCRNHNRFAAEREYGRTHVEHAIARRRSQQAPRPPHPI